MPRARRREAAGRGARATCARRLGADGRNRTPPTRTRGNAGGLPRSGKPPGQAAGVGFEPTAPREGRSGFQDRLLLARLVNFAATVATTATTSQTAAASIPTRSMLAP